VKRSPLISVVDSSEMILAAIDLHTSLEESLLPIILSDPAAWLRNRAGVTASLFLCDDLRCIFQACEANALKGRDAVCVAAVDCLRAAGHWSTREDWGGGSAWTCKRLARFACSWSARPSPLQGFAIRCVAMRLQHVHRSLLACDRASRSALRELHAAVERPMRRAS
jgi:hypothetical protein